MEANAFQKIYTKIESITKATCTIEAEGITNEEMAYVAGRPAQVVKINGNKVTLQIFSGTQGIATNSEVVFTGKPPQIKVGDELKGRFFNAYGDPIDNGPAIDGKITEIGGPSVNPVKIPRSALFSQWQFLTTQLSDTTTRIPFPFPGILFEIKPSMTTGRL